MKENHLLRRIRAIEQRLDKMLEQTVIEPREQQEHELIMSVDELKESDDFDDWMNQNWKSRSAFLKLKFIEHQWNEGKAFDWEYDELKYCLSLNINDWEVNSVGYDAQVFNFHKKEHAELFLETFAKELEIIKPLFS